MPAYALTLEYCGTPFVGWQRQDNGLSVQQVLEEAAAMLNDGIAPASTAAGRTDAGVHAEGQVVMLELSRDISPDKLRDALNFHTKPHPVSVLSAALAPEGWNPRFSAVKRGYRYRILNRRARPTLLLDRAWHVRPPLDAAAMREAAAALLGTHDFSTFRATSCQAKSPIRTLDRLGLQQHGDLIEITVEARSFLHHQVRNIVGSLKLVGENKWPIARIAQALAARARQAGGPTAPPEGLTLIRVEYEIDPFATKPDIA